MEKKKKKRHTPMKSVPQIHQEFFASTTNGQMILQLMKERKIKGKYKDHVIIHGTRLIDWLDTYEIAITIGNETKSIGVNGIALIHKSKLKNILGPDVAKQFWNNGMRTNKGVEMRRVMCVNKK